MSLIGEGTAEIEKMIMVRPPAAEHRRRAEYPSLGTAAPPHTPAFPASTGPLAY
jgi:hypothetical protein